MTNTIISPSILSADFNKLGDEIEHITKSGADWVHVDVMDGQFVPNISIGIPVVKSIKKTSKLPLDVHLMIVEPQNYIDEFAKAGADIITIHYESTKNDIKEILTHIKSLGIKAGLSIKPKTEVNEIKDLIPYTDLILVMTVEPGFSGQEFMPECAEKIKELKQYTKENQYIQVDGGINNETGSICKKYGANSLVAGNYIFKSSDYSEAIKSLKY